MQSFRLWLDHKTRSNDEPKLYLQIRLNYFHLESLDKSSVRDVQKLFNWLDYKSKNIKRIYYLPKDVLAKRLVNKVKLKEVQCLLNFSRSNFNKELNGYVYGYPSKLDLMQMQTQLRTCTGERYLLVKIIESIDSKDHKISKGDCESADRKRIKKNEIIVSLDFMTKIFKKLKDNELIAEASDDNFTVELIGYRFKIFLAIIYTFYTNELYLNLNDLPEIIEISINLGIEKILRFLNRLVVNCDPIYVLFQLRIYLKELSFSNDLSSFSSTRRMVHILSKVIANYSRLIDHPSILDLEFIEMNYLVNKRSTLFDAFKNERRNEYDLIRSILDWYLIDKHEREEQCVFLLNKIDYHCLTIEQLDKLINHLPLNHSSDFVRNFVKDQFHIEMKRRINRSIFNLLDLNHLQTNFYQDLLRYDKLECLSLPEKPVEQIKIDSVAVVKQEYQMEDNFEKSREQIALKNDYLKNLILLDTCSLTASKSLPIYYSINERSIMMLLGGFTTHLPYSKDQGRLMHHLVRTANDDKANDLPSILTHDWFPLKDRLPKNLSHFASIKIDNCILVFGGLDLNYMHLNANHKLVRPISSCYLFNLDTNKWYRLKNMNYSRAYHCAIKYDDYLVYVFGGLTCCSTSSTNNVTVTNTMEYYDIVNNKWTLVDLNRSIGILPSPRMAFGMQIVGNRILICGGISNVEDNDLNFKSTSLLDDFWSFDLDKKIFRQFTNLRLPCPRAAFGLVSLDRELFVIAGLEIKGCNEVKLNLLDCAEDYKYGAKATKLNGTAVRTSSVLVCKLDQSTRLIECLWSVHSHLNQQRVFPLVSRCSTADDSLLVMGGKQQDHLFLDKISIANNCSTYEILNRQTSKWVESPIMFACFGSSLVEL